MQKAKVRYFHISGTISAYESLTLRGVEARGFFFGPSIALAIGSKFVPLRKPRKLPGEVISEKYDLEYGSDYLEMHVGAVKHGDKAIVIDDLVATGGTLSAAITLLKRGGAIKVWAWANFIIITLCFQGKRYEYRSSK
ncbi:hypothetical protein AHAS_Ahas19G0085300 [Arachis hypogaea]